jgi:AraC-like DNA-binding protein
VVRQLPVARRTLYRKFEALVGRTILQQIHHVRFQKAKELVAESDLSLDVVARRSGFANARWLADSFRRDLGITPNRFRRQFRTEPWRNDKPGCAGFARASARPPLDTPPLPGDNTSFASTWASCPEPEIQ